MNKRTNISVLMDTGGFIGRMEADVTFAKIRSVKSPEYGTDDSAGIDFFAPDDFIPTVLNPGQDVNIPSGIMTNIPLGTALIAKNKSGVSTKKKLLKGAQVVDCDYQGEIHLHVINCGTEMQTILPGDKIVQFVHVPIIHAHLKEVKKSELYTNKTERGDKGFGSTGDK